MLVRGQEDSLNADEIHQDTEHGLIGDLGVSRRSLPKTNIQNAQNRPSAVGEVTGGEVEAVTLVHEDLGNLPGTSAGHIASG